MHRSPQHPAAASPPGGELQLAGPRGTRNAKRGTPGRKPQAASRAFTLAELLAVITIIVLLVTIAVPSISGLINSGRVEQTINTISAVTASARAEATESPAFPVGDYQGAAIVFTPSGEMRLTQHFYEARDGSDNRLVERDPPQAGYRDVAGRDYIELPPGAGVVAISRNSSSSTQLLAPPFAVRFNSSGNLTARNPDPTGTPYSAVIYNGNYGNGYAVSSERNNYNPAAYDPDSDQFDSSHRVVDPKDYDDLDNNNNGTVDEADELSVEKIELPFEVLETVVGILVYNKENMPGDLQSEMSSGSTYDWLIDNGQPVFFNRYTGALLKR